MSIITPEMKQLFNQAIDSLLEETALTIPCKLKYGSTKPLYCNNCEIDPVANKSSNIYNGTGPNFFEDNSLCPVCLGKGYIESNTVEIVYLAVLANTSPWYDWGSKTMRIPDGGTVQTLCKAELINKLTSADYITFGSEDNSTYTLGGGPQVVGFGDTNYLWSIWRQN